MTTCAICRHPLTDAVILSRGVGPDCLTSTLRRVSRAQAEGRMPLGPFAGDVLLVRHQGRPYANVPFRFKRLFHEDYAGPMLWGIEDTGTYCLALNILSQFLPPYEVRQPVGWLPDPQADVLSVDFAERFLVGAPFGGCIILQRDILAWLRREVLTGTEIHTFGVLA